jgi:hypothetical protein
MADKKTPEPYSRRAAQWAMKYDAARVAQLIELGKPRFQANAENAFALIEDIETRTKQVINAHAISVIQITPYLCYARETWKAQKIHHSDVLAREVGVKIAKWKARGLDLDILNEIAKEVFDINPLPVA